MIAGNFDRHRGSAHFRTTGSKTPESVLQDFILSPAPLVAAYSICTQLQIVAPLASHSHPFTNGGTAASQSRIHDRTRTLRRKVRFPLAPRAPSIHDASNRFSARKGECVDAQDAASGAFLSSNRRTSSRLKSGTSSSTRVTPHRDRARALQDRPARIIHRRPVGRHVSRGCHTSSRPQCEKHGARS
jgi:hypothetical protein